VTVVLLGPGEAPPSAAGLDVRRAGGDYDEVVALIEACDRVVAW